MDIRGVFQKFLYLSNYLCNQQRHMPEHCTKCTNIIFSVSMSLEGAAGKNINLVYRHTEIAKSVQTNGHELESPRDFFKYLPGSLVYC